MAVKDITVDTNVFVHASNPGEQRFDHAVQFLKHLLDCSVALCVDEGFDPDEARNRSLIGGEYHGKLTAGSLGHYVVNHLAGSGRVVMVSKKIPRDRQKIVTQIVVNKRDRTFVCVSFNSGDHVLVSHDYQDFADKKRVVIRKALGVIMHDAEQACALLP